MLLQVITSHDIDLQVPMKKAPRLTSLAASNMLMLPS
jgi:hypothetical protein